MYGSLGMSLTYVLLTHERADLVSTSVSTVHEDLLTLISLSVKCRAMDRCNAILKGRKHSIARRELSTYSPFRFL